MRRLENIVATAGVRAVETDGSGDEFGGAFIVELSRDHQKIREACVIASTGYGWDHVSVTIRHRIRRSGASGPPLTPRWPDMVKVRNVFFDETEWAIQYNPPPSDNISMHDKCLHLWRPRNVKIPVPPKELV